MATATLAALSIFMLMWRNEFAAPGVVEGRGAISTSKGRSNSEAFSKMLKGKLSRFIGAWILDESQFEQKSLKVTNFPFDRSYSTHYSQTNISKVENNFSGIPSEQDSYYPGLKDSITTASGAYDSGATSKSILHSARGLNLSSVVKPKKSTTFALGESNKTTPHSFHTTKSYFTHKYPTTEQTNASQNSDITTIANLQLAETSYSLHLQTSQYFKSTVFKRPTMSPLASHTTSLSNPFMAIFGPIPTSEANDTNDTQFNKITSFRESQNSTGKDREAIIKFFKRNYPVELWKEHGFFSDAFMEEMNDLWMRSLPPSAAAHYAMAVIYVIIMVIGTTGNGLVIYLFTRSRALRTPANILVLNLAISDFFLLLNMVLFIYNSILRGPALGLVGCQLYGFLGGLTGTVSIVTLAFIAYDRYSVIVFPMEPMRKTSHARARFMVLFSWAYGTTFSSLPLAGVGIRAYTPEGYLTSCSFDYLSRERINLIYIWSYFAAAWVLPLALIMFCYSQIYHMVLRTADMASAVDSQRHCREEEKRRSELKLAGIVAGVVVLWFVSWTPYAVVALLGITGQHHLITPLSSMIPALFCKTASSIDPFIYAVTHPRFRKEMLALWRGARKRDRSQGHKRKKAPWTVEGARSERDALSVSTDDDVEEVVVMVAAAERGLSLPGDSASASSASSSASTAGTQRARKRRRRSQRISWTMDQPFPFSHAVINQLQPPSWFVPPRPYSNRSTSLRLKERTKDAAEPKSM